MPRLTPFHSRAEALCKGKRWEEWSGFLTATMYELDHIHEYHAVRAGCGLFDVSPLFKYDVRGRDAEALDLQVQFRQPHPFEEGKTHEPDGAQEVPGRIDDDELPFLVAGVGIEVPGAVILLAVLGFDPLQPLDAALGVIFEDFRFPGQGRSGGDQQDAKGQEANECRKTHGLGLFRFHATPGCASRTLCSVLFVVGFATGL